MVKGIVYFIIGSVALLFAGVQPWINALYAVLTIVGFGVLMWQGRAFVAAGALGLGDHGAFSAGDGSADGAGVKGVSGVGRSGAGGGVGSGRQAGWDGMDEPCCRLFGLSGVCPVGVRDCAGFVVAGGGDLWGADWV